MPEQTPPALIHAGRRGGKLARLIAVETARGGELEIDAERDMWRERAERGQLHRDQLVDQLNAARARVAELEAQQQPRVIETPEDAAALADALRAAVDSWPNRAWLVLPGPTDIGSELAGHLTKELAGWRPPARVIADPEELSALPAGALVHDGTAVFDHLGAGWWVTTGSADPIHSEAILEAEPDGTCGCTVIVLWTPEADIQSDIRILLLGKEFEARAAIDRARKLHQPENGCDNPVHTVPDATCPQCCDYCQCCGEAMPCATIRAIDGEDSRFPTPKAGDFTGGVR